MKQVTDDDSSPKVEEAVLLAALPQDGGRLGFRQADVHDGELQLALHGCHLIDDRSCCSTTHGCFR